MLQHLWSGGEANTGWSPPKQASKEARNVSAQIRMEGKINYALYTNIHLILLSTKALASPSNSLVMCRYCLFGTKKEHGVLGLAIFIPYIFHIYGYIPKSWTQLSDWTELTEYDLIDNSLIIIESLLRVVAKDLWSRLISWVWILASPLTSWVTSGKLLQLKILMLSCQVCEITIIILPTS